MEPIGLGFEEEFMELDQLRWLPPNGAVLVLTAHLVVRVLIHFMAQLLTEFHCACQRLAAQVIECLVK